MSWSSGYHDSPDDDASPGSTAAGIAARPDHRKTIEGSVDMAWRTGAVLFCEMWPLIRARIEPEEDRRDFVLDLLVLFEKYDLDLTDLEGLHPEVDRAIQALGEEDDGGDWHPAKGEGGEWHPVEPDTPPS
jgi:hypothetical protein